MDASKLIIYLFISLVYRKQTLTFPSSLCLSHDKLGSFPENSPKHQMVEFFTIFATMVHLTLFPFNLFSLFACIYGFIPFHCHFVDTVGNVLTTAGYLFSPSVGYISIKNWCVRDCLAYPRQLTISRFIDILPLLVRVATTSFIFHLGHYLYGLEVKYIMARKSIFSISICEWIYLQALLGTFDARRDVVLQ